MGVRVVAGMDGGNSKTELALATLEGELVGYCRGPGSNSHAIGAERVAELVSAMYRQLSPGPEPARLALFCCGADVPSDVEALTAAFARHFPRETLFVENDTFALLHTGRRGADAVAVVCGAGINVVGQRGDGSTVRYPSLGWETGDWGGAEMLGREALFLAARAADGRGLPTALGEAIERHYGCALEAVGAAIHYRRWPMSRIGEIAPIVVALAEQDRRCRDLLERLAGEVSLMAWRALRDLDLLDRECDVVLGGAMLANGGALAECAGALVAPRAPQATIRISTSPPVLGAVAVALEHAGATAEAVARWRSRSLPEPSLLGLQAGEAAPVHTAARPGS